MKMDMLNLDSCDSVCDSVHKSISMMHDFVLGTYPCESYNIDEIDNLDLHKDEKNTIKHILSSKMKSTHREFIGTDNQGRIYFSNWII